jgi:Family of unknown function (DUF6573)
MTEGEERAPHDKIRSRGAPRGWAWYIERAEAIAQRDLIDVSEQAREAGISCPVAVTSVTWSECLEVPGRSDGGEMARLRRLLESLRDAISPLHDGWERVKFVVDTPGELWRRRMRPVTHLDAIRGTGDDGEPVITVKVPAECYYWDENLPLARRIHDALAANERPDDEGVVACLLETPAHHSALRHAVQVDGATVEHLAAALWCGRRLQTLISTTNPHRVVFRDMAEDDSSC